MAGSLWSCAFIEEKDGQSVRAFARKGHIWCDMIVGVCITEYVRRYVSGLENIEGWLLRLMK